MMAEVKVRGADLSGLGWAIKSLIDGNLEKPQVLAKVARIQGTLVVRETGADVSNTVFFNNGQIEIEDGAVPNPTAALAAGFDEISEVTSGAVGPIRAVLLGKMKVRGNIWKLLKMAKAIIIQ
jgi:hypothetical protein